MLNENESKKIQIIKNRKIDKLRTKILRLANLQQIESDRYPKLADEIENLTHDGDQQPERQRHNQPDSCRHNRRHVRRNQ